ncbi:SHOCT domain-containing protein [Halostagnicola bangensis]
MADNSDFLRIVVLVVATVVLVPLLLMVFAWPMMGMWGGGHMWNDGAQTGPAGTWMWLLAWLPLLLILLVGGSLLYRAVVSPRETEEDPALEELRIAYARGNLSDEEFEQRRKRLEQDEYREQ